MILAPSMHDQRWASSATVLVAAVAAGTTFYYVSSKIQTGKHPANTTRTLAVPYASPGIFEAINRFSGPECPLFLLALIKETKMKGSVDGTFRLPLLVPGGVYVIGSYKLCRQIMIDPTTDKVPKFYAAYNQMTGSMASIFSGMNSEYQTMVRKSTRHAFSNKEIDRMSSICQSLIETWIEQTAMPLAESGTEFDPSSEMIKVVMKVICLAGFEYEITDEEDEEFVESMEKCLREYFRQAVSPLRKVLGPLLVDVREAKISANKIQAFAARVLEAYRQNPLKSDTNTLIKLIDGNDKYCSDRERIGEMIIYLLGGHDTTGFTLATTLILLAKHPDVAEKLRAELKRVPTEKWDTDCDYLKFVVKESMRLYPVAAINGFRKLGKDYETDDGKILPQGSTCVMLNAAFGRDERYFEDPENFNPDRWWTATEDMKGAMMNFAAGNRGCVGQALAMAKLYTIIPRIMMTFSLELAKEGKPDYFLTWKIIGANLILKKL